MKQFYFFIGTEAELIKLFPVLKEFNRRNINFEIIASGQNNIKNSPLLKKLNLKPDIILSHDVSNEKPTDLIIWSIKTFFNNFYKLKKEFEKKDKKSTFLVVHGDTVSTVMGAIFGKLFGLRVVHVEAGLRSFNFMSPIPEEIDRFITSKITDIHFCPNEWAIKNLSNLKGDKVNTKQNTLYDAFKLTLKEKVKPQDNKLKNKKYFVLIIHRQENILRKKLIMTILKEILSDTKNLTCVFVLHKITKSFLEEQGLLEVLRNKKNVILSDRMDYSKFLFLIKDSEFFITDGGSNQEEAYYLGKPCLILRSRSERIEGLNENVVLSNFDDKVIRSFIQNYKNFQRNPIITRQSPAKIIADYLSKS